MLHACGVDIGELVKKLGNFIEVELSSIVDPNGSTDVQPTASFQRVIQRAIIHTQSSGHEIATGANALVSIFSERESHAVWFLKSLNMTRLDAVSYISHGSESNVAKVLKKMLFRKLGASRVRSAFPICCQSDHEGSGWQN